MENSIRYFSIRVESASNPQNQTQTTTQSQQPMQQTYHKQQPIHPYQQPSYPKQIPSSQYPHSNIQMTNQYSNVPMNGYNQMQHHIQQQPLQQPSHIQNYQPHSSTYQSQHQMYQNIPPQPMQPLHQGMHQQIQTQPQQIQRMQKPTQSNYQQQMHQPIISKQKLVQQPISQQIPIQQQYPQQTQQSQLHQQQTIYNKSRYNQPIVQRPSFQQYYPYESTSNIIDPQQNQYPVMNQQGYSNMPQYIQPGTSKRQIPPSNEPYGINYGTGKMSKPTEPFSEENIKIYYKMWHDTEGIAKRCMNSPSQNNPNFQKIVNLFRSVYTNKPTIDDLKNPDYIKRLRTAYDSIKKLIEANKKKEMSQQMSQKLSPHMMSPNIGSSGTMINPMHDFDKKNVNMMKQQQPIVIKSNDPIHMQPPIQQKMPTQQQYHPPPSQQYIAPTHQQYHPPPQLQRQTQIQPSHPQVPRQIKPPYREVEVPPMSFELIIDNIKKMREPEKNNALELFLKQYKKGIFNVSNKENFERLYREIMKGENEDRFFWWNINDEDDNVDADRIKSSFFRSQSYENNQEVDKFMSIDDFNLMENNNDPFEVFKTENPILM